MDWLDEFYKDLEDSLENYTRPADWRERFERVKNRGRSPVTYDREGKTSGDSIES